MGNCCGSDNEAAEDNTMFYDGDGNCYLWDDDNFQGFTRVDNERHFTRDEINLNIFWDDLDPLIVLDVSGILDVPTMLKQKYEELSTVTYDDASQTDETTGAEDGEENVPEDLETAEQRQQQSVYKLAKANPKRLKKTKRGPRQLSNKITLTLKSSKYGKKRAKKPGRSKWNTRPKSTSQRRPEKRGPKRNKRISRKSEVSERLEQQTKKSRSAKSAKMKRKQAKSQ